MVLKFYNSVEKVVNLKFKKFWKLISMFVEVTGEKLVGDLLPHILNREQFLFNDWIALYPFHFHSVKTMDLDKMDRMLQSYVE